MYLTMNTVSEILTPTQPVKKTCIVRPVVLVAAHAVRSRESKTIVVKLISNQYRIKLHKYSHNSKKNCHSDTFTAKSKWDIGLANKNAHREVQTTTWQQIGKAAATDQCYVATFGKDSGLRFEIDFAWKGKTNNCFHYIITSQLSNACKTKICNMIFQFS